MNVFDRYAPFVQDFIYRNNWESLRAIQAAAGDVIKLTVTADDGYSLESLTVKDSSANPLTVTDKTFTMPASNVTVNASFVKYFTVKYESEHGTAPAAITVKENTELTAELLTALEADGFTFTGWYDGETKVEAGYKVTKNVTLTARWGGYQLTQVMPTKIKK